MTKHDQFLKDVDPITFEVIRNSLTAISNEMALVVAKSAYSTPVNEGRDFAGTLYDRHGKLVSQGEFDLPAFAGVTQLTVPEVINQVGIASMRAGDVFMINDPYVASTHCNDVHLVKPVFKDHGIVAFVASSAHWSDVGGVSPGSLNCRAKTHFEEGLRIPAVAIVRQGEMNHDVLSIILANMRESWERLGDLQAQLAALRTGEARILGMFEQHGTELLLRTMEDIQDYSEKLVRASITALPDGVYRSEDRVDQDVATGLAKTIRLTMTISGDEIEFDFTASDPKADSGINCTIAATTSAVFISMASILPPVPMNAGVMRAVEIKATKGSLLWAVPPSAISGLAATSMECVIGCVMQALSQALPERGTGSPFSILNTVFAGHDSRAEFDTDFFAYIWGFGGIGASRTHDGASIVGSPYTASTQNIPCELQERRFPMLWWRYQFRQDSGGAGASRGGLGSDQLVEFPYNSGDVSCIGNRERFGPPGVFGGGAGGLARLVMNPSDEAIHGSGRALRNIGIFAVNEPAEQGDLLSFWAAGGGGYGDPLDRDPADVLEDVLDDYVSIDGAAADYGVVIEEIDRRSLEYRIDLDATTALRTHKRSTQTTV